MPTARLRSKPLVGLGAGATLLGLSYLATTWYRYGRAKPRLRSDGLLDRFMPTCEVTERSETVVNAPAPATWAAAQALNLNESPVIRAIFAGRALLMRAKPPADPKSERFLDEVRRLGWGVLAEELGRALVMGAVTQPWKADVTFRSLPPDDFAAFDEPGYAKIAWAIAVEPLGPDRCVFRTETRVATTDPDSRARFRRYWTVFSPGILLIRWETLRLVKQAAEGRERIAAELASG